MRIVRNGYFWMVLGTIAFVWLMSRSASVHVSRQDMEEIQAEREADGKDTDRLSPFGMGFMTACAVGGFWFAVHCQTSKSDRSGDSE